jgi:hypothetical protein
MARDLQKRRHRTAERARAILPPGTQVRGVFLGRAQPRWDTTAIVLLVVMLTVIGVGVLLGQLLFPGALLIFAFSNSLRPIRILVLADQGVALLSRSMWTSKPDAVLGYESLGALNGLLAGSTNKVAFGPEMVTLTRREITGLITLAPQPYDAPASPPMG